MSTFPLQIVTPDGSIFEGEAEALRLRTSEGYISIRACHADYVAVLDIGATTVTHGGREYLAACGGGFLSVKEGRVNLIAASFEYADQIDVPRAELSKKRAEEILTSSKEEKELRLAKARLSRALNRLRIADTI